MTRGSAAQGRSRPSAAEITFPSADAHNDLCYGRRWKAENVASCGRGQPSPEVVTESRKDGESKRGRGRTFFTPGGIVELHVIDRMMGKSSYFLTDWNSHFIFSCSAAHENAAPSNLVCPPSALLFPARDLCRPKIETRPPAALQGSSRRRRAGVGGAEGPGEKVLTSGTVVTGEIWRLTGKTAGGRDERKYENSREAVVQGRRGSGMAVGGASVSPADWLDIYHHFSVPLFFKCDRDCPRRWTPDTMTGGKDKAALFL